jgi:hypothetical protein
VIVLDAIGERRPPFSPEAVTAEFATLLKSYGITKITGDRWGGEFPREAFRKHGVTYETAAKTKSEFYAEALPLLNSGRVELLDEPRLIAQIVGLERRTSRSGKDSIDHAPGGHDDVANAALAGLVLAAGKSGRILFTEEMVIALENASALDRFSGGQPLSPFGGPWH